MAQFEWEKTAQRQDVAALLRQLADGLDGGGEVELEQDDWKLEVAVADQVTLEVELEVGAEETELEIELSWPTGGDQPEPGAEG